MKIILCDLEHLCSAIFTKIEAAGLTTIYLSEDYCWNIFFDDACNPAKKTKPGMGSLFDDWNALKKFNTGGQPITFIELYGIGNLITAIGNEFQKLPKKTPPNDWPLVLSDLRQACDFIFTNIKANNQHPFEELNPSFTHYWRVDLNRIYQDEPPKNSQVNLQLIQGDLLLATFNRIQN